MKVSVILPTYNESENLGPLVEDILARLGDQAHEVIVVDDDSPDETWRVAQDLARGRESLIRVIRRRRDRGLRASLAEGIAAAQGEVVVWMDADFSMPPRVIPDLCKAIQNGAEVAVGSRYVPGGNDGRSDIPLHRVLSRMITKVASVILVPSFRDYTSGFIAVRAEVLRTLLPLQGDYGEYFIALIYKAYKSGRTVVEIPYTCEPRRHGESKTASNLLGFLSRGLGYVRLIARVRLGG